MRKRNILLIPIFLVLLIVGLFAHAIYMDQNDWREDTLRYNCGYTVSVTGLSGKEVQGTTVIMVPIPASKEGKFFTPPAQKDPYFTQKLMHEILNWPEEDRKGPYFRNATEFFDDREAIGDWTTFIAETDKGYMLGFRTNETRLKDIEFGDSFVVDHFDVFDPINNGSPILFPIENVTNISSVPYGDYTMYASNPTYDTYVYISDNLKGEIPLSFDIELDANNDPTEWPEKYRSRYLNLVLSNVNDAGYVKVSAFLGQVLPQGNNMISLFESQYIKDYYDNKTSHVVNETPNYTEVI